MKKLERRKRSRATEAAQNDSLLSELSIWHRLLSLNQQLIESIDAALEVHRATLQNLEKFSHSVHTAAASATTLSHKKHSKSRSVRQLFQLGRRLVPPPNSDEAVLREIELFFPPPLRRQHRWTALQDRVLRESVASMHFSTSELQTAHWIIISQNMRRIFEKRIVNPEDMSPISCFLRWHNAVNVNYAAWSSVEDGIVARVAASPCGLFAISVPQSVRNGRGAFQCAQRFQQHINVLHVSQRLSVAQKTAIVETFEAVGARWNFISATVNSRVPSDPRSSRAEGNVTPAAVRTHMNSVQRRGFPVDVSWSTSDSVKLCCFAIAFHFDRKATVSAMVALGKQKAVVNACFLQCVAEWKSGAPVTFPFNFSVDLDDAIVSAVVKQRATSKRQAVDWDIVCHEVQWRLRRNAVNVTPEICMRRGGRLIEGAEAPQSCVEFQLDSIRQRILQGQSMTVEATSIGPSCGDDGHPVAVVPAALTPWSFRLFEHLPQVSKELVQRAFKSSDISSGSAPNAGIAELQASRCSLAGFGKVGALPPSQRARDALMKLIRVAFPAADSSSGPSERYNSSQAYECRDSTTSDTIVVTSVALFSHAVEE